jgi:hypothetical protein
MPHEMPPVMETLRHRFIPPDPVMETLRHRHRPA